MRPVTVAETLPFLRQAASLWDEEERSAFVDFIAANPEAGDVIPDTGGIRKLRWSRPGTGKRGGVRVISLLSRRRHAALPAADLRQGAAGELDAGGEAARSDLGLRP